ISIMYSFPALLVGMVIMMAGQMYAAAIRGFPAGRGNFPKILASTPSDASDPIASIDFYFPFKDLQNQIQLANIECPAPGGSYDQALSLISMNCPSSETGNVPINPCCTQNMLTDLAGAVECVQSSDTSLASSMRSATKDFIQQCQQAGVNGLSDPLLTSSSIVSSTRPSSSVFPTASVSKSAVSTISSTISSPSPSSSPKPVSASFAPSVTSSSTSIPSPSATSQSSSALKSIPWGPSISMMGTIGMILTTTLATLIYF
ncbi:hypothetical protein GGU11DRAFT_767757, partial [Lentinula aff. detonsa]